MNQSQFVGPCWIDKSIDAFGIPAHTPVALEIAWVAVRLFIGDIESAHPIVMPNVTGAKRISHRFPQLLLLA
jgi:hypothetical protein